jgi:hypothetical protein
MVYIIISAPQAWYFWMQMLVHMDPQDGWPAFMTGKLQVISIILLNFVYTVSILKDVFILKLNLIIVYFFP